MYTFHSRVRYSEVDHKRRLTLPGVINYFQDCSTFQSEDIGCGVERLLEEGKAWILSYWQIVIEDYPKLGEEIDISTWATGFKGILGDRNFQITDAGGRRIAGAYSLWVYMDTGRGRPARPSKEEIASYGVEEPLDMEYEPRRIELPEEMTEAESIRVHGGMIDTNEHVNNAQYVQMALDALGKDAHFHRLRVEYKSSAVLGDVIVPKIAVSEERTVVVLSAESGEIYAVVELKG